MPKKSTKSIQKKSDAAHVDDGKREFLVNTTAAFGMVGAACAAYPFIQSMAPSESVKAQATLEVDLNEIPAGDTKTYMWQGKPVFIWHRNEAQLAEARARDNSPDLLDPAPDSTRVQKEEWLVVMGICTHLGCVPLRGGEAGGWRCPCHGSQFDNAGRLTRGPAATNLEIPPYEFLSDTKIKIG